MLSKSTLECEMNQLKRLERLQLPNWVKKIGIGIAVATFIGLFVNRFTINLPELRLVCKYGMLVGLLLVSLSKEKIEDELVTRLRMQSYTFAFVAGVILTLIQPFLNFSVDYLLDPNQAQFKDTGDFEILWILLSVQVFYFAMLKRFHR